MELPRWITFPLYSELIRLIVLYSPCLKSCLEGQSSSHSLDRHGPWIGLIGWIGFHCGSKS